MKMHIKYEHSIVLFALFLCGILTSTVTHAESIDTMSVSPIHGSNAYSRAQGLSPQARAQLQTLLRQKIHGNLIEVEAGACQTLMELGDNETIERVIQLYRGDSYSQSAEMGRQMSRCSQPMLLPMLSEYIFRAEPVKWIRYLGGEILDYPISIRTCWVMRQIVINSPVFGSDVKRSFEVFKDESDDSNSTLRLSLREWWHQNKEAFARKDYVAVKPMRPVAPAMPVIQTNPASPAPHQPSNALSILVPSRFPPEPVGLKNRMPSLYLLIFGAGILCSGLFILLLVARQKRTRL